ncbi:MAG: sortase, partial [Oscillospiraceae bacterium]
RIHTLKAGDIISFTTRLGTRTYEVTGVAKVSVYDVSGLEPTAANMVTLYTCVNDQPAYRWCVTAREV